MPKNLWSRDELILAFYWYCTKISFTKIKYTKPEVIELAQLVGRTPSAAALKLVNFARLDPSLQKRGVKGMTHGGNTEKPIWDEFHNNWNELTYISEKLISERKGISIEEVSQIETFDLPEEGKERMALVKVRINQSFFRKTVLLSYQNKCCITGLTVPTLLVASHIKPWAVDLKQAANPENGLCLNGLHDKAFDNFLISITPDFKIKISKRIKEYEKEKSIQQLFLKYESKRIDLPNRFVPDKEFLEWHSQRLK